MTDYTFLLELERELHGTGCRHDQPRLETLLAPGFFEFGASGRIWVREQTIAKLPLEPTSGPAITSSDYAAHPLAPDVVLVTYKADIPGQGPTNRSSLWRKNGQQWQMEFHQGTKVPPDVI